MDNGRSRAIVGCDRGAFAPSSLAPYPSNHTAALMPETGLPNPRGTPSAGSWLVSWGFGWLVGDTAPTTVRISLGLSLRSVAIGLGPGIAPSAWVWRGDRCREHYPRHIEGVSNITRNRGSDPNGVKSYRYDKAYSLSFHYLNNTARTVPSHHCIPGVDASYWHPWTFELALPKSNLNQSSSNGVLWL